MIHCILLELWLLDELLCSRGIQVCHYADFYYFYIERNCTHGNFSFSVATLCLTSAASKIVLCYCSSTAFTQM
uniref:Putative secreted protein n=1 Tax=Rhipicephalus microplus TaxID=6941 RepID=A0A6G5A157_RHIMP